MEVDISKYNMTEKELDNLVNAFKMQQLENKSMSTALWSKPDIETLNLTIKMLYEEIPNGDVEKIQTLATAIKELAIAKAALSDSKTGLFKFYIIENTANSIISTQSDIQELGKSGTVICLQ